MEIQTPVGWLTDIADKHPDRICLVLADGEVSYGNLWRFVRERALAIGREVATGSIVTVPVRNDMASVVELLSVALAGAVPLPYMGTAPTFDPDLRSSDAILVQTSGSTGMPSIVRISSANISASVAASRARLGNIDADRWLACLPLNHVGGLAVVWRSLEVGGSVVLAPFNEDLPELIRRTNPTIASVVPTMLRHLINQDASLLSEMRFVLVGGAAMSKPLFDEAERAGVAVVPTYGMTETTSQIATGALISESVAESWPPHGTPMDGLTITIESESGEDVAPGDVGRITVEGPAVSVGYLGRPDRTKAFRTNDLGSLDSDGRLTVLGRSDDVIVSGGENVSLPTVVNAVRGFDGVVDAVALGLEDARWGTVVGVMVAGEVDVSALRAAAKADLAPHERPKVWAIVDSLPVLETGKPDLTSIRRSIQGR